MTWYLCALCGRRKGKEEATPHKEQLLLCVLDQLGVFYFSMQLPAALWVKGGLNSASLRTVLLTQNYVWWAFFLTCFICFISSQNKIWRIRCSRALLAFPIFLQPNQGHVLECVVASPHGSRRLPASPCDQHQLLVEGGTSCANPWGMVKHQNLSERSYLACSKV